MTSRYDPVPDLAALIDGLRRMTSRSGGAQVIALADLLTGPYAGLRGGLLLDEPGRENVSTADALREALGEMTGETWRTQQAALGAYARQNADVHRENLLLRDENATLREALGEMRKP